MILTIINTILILFIIIATIINSIYLYRFNNKNTTAFEDLKKQVNNKVDKGISLMDVAEFDKLDPRIKAHYKNYMVSKILPALMNFINKKAESGKLYEYIDNNKNEIDNQINLIIEELNSEANKPFNMQMFSPDNITPVRGDDTKPIDCQLSEWTAWSDCSKPCEGGEKIRTRQIIYGPQNGGLTCGETTEIQPCNEMPCDTNAQQPIQQALL